MSIFRLIRKDTKENTDKELIDKYKVTGEMDLLGELYSRYMHLIYGVCLRYLKNRDESKDAVMQIFEKIIIEIPRHDVENFSSWIHTVSRNYCLMQLRSEKARNEKLSEWMNDEVIFMENENLMHPIDEDSPNDTLLMDCIEKLKKEQRECIKLFYFGNMCYNDIANNMKTDEKRVKSYLQNAKRNLRICLEETNEKE
jgi:RNA polymerase sigma-70 factor, ECF subfamily